MNFFNKSSYSITFSYLMLFTLPVLVLFVFFYWSIFSYLIQQKEDSISNKMSTLQSRFERDGFPGLRAELSDKIAQVGPGDTAIYLLVDNGYRRLMGNLNRWPDIALDEDGWLDFRLDDYDGYSVDRYLARARTITLDNNYTLLVGQSLEDLYRVRQQLIKTSFWGLLVMIVLALISVGYLSSGKNKYSGDSLNSSSLRITFIYVMLFSLSVLVLFAFFYWSTFSYLIQQKENTINAKMETLQSRFERDGFLGLRVDLSDQIAQVGLGDTAIYLLVDDKYSRLMGNLNKWPDLALDEHGWLDFRLDDYGSSLDRYLARARAITLNDNYTLLVGQSLEDLYRVRQQLIKTSLWGLLMLIAFASVGGRYLHLKIIRHSD